MSRDTGTTIIVGGVAAGMSAATRLRRRDENARIIVLERGADVSFANCGLPYHLSDVIPERSALVLQTPERLGRRFGLDVRVRSEVVAIDRAAKTVTVRRADGTEYSEGYDQLVLAMGAAPVRPAIPGVERAHVLRDLADLDGIVAGLDAGARSAVVMGAGYVGIEVAENLVKRGLAVTVVQSAPQVLGTLDAEMAHPVAERMRAHGVDLRLATTATAVGADTVMLDDGTAVAADLVVAAVGVRPDTGIAAEAGLTIGATGGIAVDARLRTDDPAIHALGDVAEKVDARTGAARLVALAGPANRQGRLVADIIAGDEVDDRALVGTAIISVFGLAAASVGATERELRAAGMPVRVIHTHPTQHAGYYPGATSLSLKLLVDPATDAILGAQAVGENGVDTRIDVLATAMAGGIPASGLMDLELAYAPQFGSAKDPINMLGYVADNLRTGLDRSIQWHELERELEAGATFLDVRAKGQLAEGAIPGAEWVPVEELRARVDDLRGRRVVVHCRVGQGAHTALRLLLQEGVDAVNLDGGFVTWAAGTAAESVLAPVAA